jgi:predicted RNA-binding protein YlxR (DUF448 family)
VLTADGRATVDRVGPGRGAWLCVPATDCFRLAVRRKAFERAWRRPVGPGALAELAAALGTSNDDVTGRRAEPDVTTRRT